MWLEEKDSMRLATRFLLGIRRVMVLAFVLCSSWSLPSGGVTQGAEPSFTAARVPLADLRVAGSPDPPLPFEVVTVFSDLKVSRPVLLVADPLAIRNRVRSAPGEPLGYYQRFVIAHRYGRLLTFDSSGTGKSTTKFLDLTPAEILSLAFHPNYSENRQVYVLAVRTNPPVPDRRIQLLRFQVDREGTQACDPASEKMILEWDTEGHTGGSLLFGPDGMLYISVGDGSAGGDKKLSGQDISDLNASILRIDVNHEDDGKAYAIPTDNPFVNTTGARGEVWALGLRNPWRTHFDPDGRLWVGDVGESRYESILIAEKGDNFGWSLSEGGHPYKPDQTQGPGRLRQPVIVHSHLEARSLIGGVTYQGDRLPGLRGAYIYGDHITGMIWAARRNPDGSVQTEKICDTGRMISSFATDAAGEIFFLDFNKSAICSLVPAAPAPPPKYPFPLALSETGLFENVARHEPRPGVIPYEINASLWSDGTVKRRWLAIPGEGRIQYSGTRPWKFPEGTVLLKSFGYPSSSATASRTRWVETRLMVLQKGRWAGYSYRWNDEGTDAELVGEQGDQASFVESQPGRGEVTRVWNFPSRLLCFACHTEGANYILGFQLAQLNRPCGSDGANQLETFDSWGLFEEPPVSNRPQVKAKAAPSKVKSRSFPGAARRSFDEQVPNSAESGLAKSRSTPRRVGEAPEAIPSTGSESPGAPSPVAKPLALQAAKLPKLVDPADASAPLELRARSYLHANCAHCHCEGGSGNSALRLGFSTSLAEMRLLSQQPEHGLMDLPQGSSLLMPGKPDESVLLARMRIRGSLQMPPLGTHLPDRQGLDLIRTWIDSLANP